MNQQEDYMKKIQEFLVRKIEDIGEEETTKKYLTQPTVLYTLNIIEDEAYMVYAENGSIDKHIQITLPLCMDWIVMQLQRYIQILHKIDVSKEKVREIISLGGETYLEGKYIDINDMYISMCTTHFQDMKSIFLWKIEECGVKGSEEIEFYLI